MGYLTLERGADCISVGVDHRIFDSQHFECDTLSIRPDTTPQPVNTPDCPYTIGRPIRGLPALRPRGNSAPWLGPWAMQEPGTPSPASSPTQHCARLSAGPEQPRATETKPNVDPGRDLGHIVLPVPTGALAGRQAPWAK